MTLTNIGHYALRFSDAIEVEVSNNQCR